jgi:hypothetical protein
MHHRYSILGFAFSQVRELGILPELPLEMNRQMPVARSTESAETGSARLLSPGARFLTAPLAVVLR